MPRQPSARIDFGYGWLRGEDWWGDPMSDNMVMMDALLHPSVKTMTLSSPPASSEVGDQYIVADGAAGTWTNEDGKLATRYEDRWRFVAPFRGLRLFVDDLDEFYWFNGEQWVSEKDGSGGVDPNTGKRYDVLCSVGYPPEPFESLLVVPLLEVVTLPKDAVGSKAVAQNIPSSNVTFTIYRNGVSVGTVTFTTAGFTGTFNVPADAVFSIGDVLSVQAGEQVPGNFQNFGIALRTIIPT